MSSIHRVIGFASVLLTFGAVYGCEKHEKTYGTSDAEMLRQQFDLTDEVMSLPCLDPEVRSGLQETKELTYYHPELVRDTVQILKDYIAAEKRRVAAGASCD